ncbi:uncharacterized protein C8R40DRAFT_1176091 [Lentinula edodes]|uniref:uncharacterized protein n=1 Tax=Lentinula edodes TaxID=5353 RepID=UPI001E8CB012|nr:uncharacterized protein C8R40DRAFT_1176091 [Lentinula edodes]KAH7869981.1 hypothetical protein C8R40DRAFT_1176091 [Lentinula edodes]
MSVTADIPTLHTPRISRFVDDVLQFSGTNVGTGINSIVVGFPAVGGRLHNRYFESPSPSVILHASSLITAKRLNDEVVFRVPCPQNTKLADEVAFLDVASRKLSLVVVPPLTQYKIQGGAGLKVPAKSG